MTTSVEKTSEATVRKSVTVKASRQQAFQIFTEGADSWWPRGHHLGKVPMRKQIIEGRAGGRCYSEQVDDTECDWGRILVWEPPARFVIAWQIGADWIYEPDLTKASEVQVRFTALTDGSTRVDLEHSHFERHGAGADSMRTGVGGENGWSGMLELFAAQAQRKA